MELLSPASNLKHIEIAINSQADSVYGGLKKWNARHKAVNFTIDEYNYLIDELHKNGIKFFLTLNTLMLDFEIDEIVAFLKNNKLPDSFIVADIGLIVVLKKEFPNVPLHFSTQFGSHNKDDIRFIEKVGGTRAILARELTLKEINNLKIYSNIELECFVWGSQCISYSGLCFFGSLIKGGSGNRGKCMITCRDLYMCNETKGHFLYIPDLDCTNLIPELKGLECIKLEGRRRNPIEIEQILKRIKSGAKSTLENGFIYGKTVDKNHLFEKFNSRIKPLFKKSELERLYPYDVFMKFENNKPILITNENRDDVYYVYSEYKKDFSMEKKNVSFDLTIEANSINEILYVNFKGEGKTFIDEKKIGETRAIFDINSFINDIENISNTINVYKIMYKRTNINSDYYISSIMLQDIFDFLRADCKTDEKLMNSTISMQPLKKLYIETNDLKVVEKFYKDDFIKIIYNISSKSNLIKINQVQEKYASRLVYKLPLFNWESDDLTEYYKKLENEEVLFTRLSQLEATKNIIFKDKHVDYTIYIWNKNSLKFIENYNIKGFTISPELNYEENIAIFNNRPLQMIIGGRLPLVYTRQCFNHLYGCKGCFDLTEKKEIMNIDKNIGFQIICESDHRFIISNKPMLNDIKKLDIRDNITFRYMTYGDDIETIEKTIDCFKTANYFEELSRLSSWRDSYEGNIIESRA